MYKWINSMQERNFWIYLVSCFHTKYQKSCQFSSNAEKMALDIWFKVDLEPICQTKCTIGISQDKRFEEDHLRNYRSWGKTNDPWSSISAPLVPPLLTLLPDAAIAGRTCKRAQWSEAGRTERIVRGYCSLSPPIMPGNIQTTEETFVRNGGMVIPNGFNKARK